MLYPFVNELPRDAQMISSFGGLDRGAVIAENYFSDMKNMSSDAYPLLSPRAARGRTGITGAAAMQICNTYITRDDVQEGAIREDVFALVENSEGGAVLSFRDREGGEVMSSVTIGGEADETTLIAQAGYVYAFPQGYRRACYAGGESGPLKNEIEAVRIAENGSDGVSASIVFKMEPCDSEGRNGSEQRTSKRANGVYTSGSSVGRLENQLIIVDAEGLSVNEYGRTVYVSNDGNATKIENFVAGEISLSGNEATFAITGHGTAASWIADNISVGDKVQRDGDVITVYPKDAYIVVYEKPEVPVNGTVWWDKATGGKYVWNSAYNEWVAYTTNYILLSFHTVGAGELSSFIEIKRNGGAQRDLQGNPAFEPFEGFKEGDAIKIDGISEEYDGSYTIAAIGARGLILNGIVDDAVSVILEDVNSSVTIKRSVPKMDFVIESGNRLWGCFYGIGEDGKVINEIYASALGDPTNWYRYEGISTDSWTATVGADGPFTGAIQYDGYPVFFKENTIIRVYGSAPSSFQLASYNYRGVQAGSAKSLAICDEVLYYLSDDGVMAYNGSVPQKVSDALGNEKYKSGVAGSIGSKYYLSCLDSSDNAHLFVFDARYGLWHREDDLEVCQFLRHKTELYMLTGGDIITAAGGEEDVEFEATTGEWGLTDPFRKYFDKFLIRAAVTYEGALDAYISYDGGSFEHIASFMPGEGVTEIPLIPYKSDRIRLKFKGRGRVRIVFAYREISDGGDYVY